MDDRNWLTPVALTGEVPVPHLVVDLLFAEALVFQPVNHPLLGFFVVQAVQEVRVDVGTVAGVGFLLDLAALYDFLDWQVELACKGVVTLIVGWYGHYGTSTV